MVLDVPSARSRSGGFLIEGSPQGRMGHGLRTPPALLNPPVVMGVLKSPGRPHGTGAVPDDCGVVPGDLQALRSLVEYLFYCVCYQGRKNAARKGFLSVEEGI